MFHAHCSKTVISAKLAVHKFSVVENLRGGDQTISTWIFKIYKRGQRSQDASCTTGKKGGFVKKNI
jgi:hypothetical protein